MKGYKSKEELDKEEQKHINEVKNERKYSKKALIYGAIGMGVVGLDVYLSSKVGVESFSKEFRELNPYEIATNALFGLSSMTTLIGGTIYGISHIFDENKEEGVKNLESKV
jgi:hypothetical protein